MSRNSAEAKVRVQYGRFELRFLKNPVNGTYDPNYPPKSSEASLAIFSVNVAVEELRRCPSKKAIGPQEHICV
jgi:hypothetical protein